MEMWFTAVWIDLLLFIWTPSAMIVLCVLLVGTAECMDIVFSSEIFVNLLHYKTVSSYLVYLRHAVYLRSSVNSLNRTHTTPSSENSAADETRLEEILVSASC